MISFEFNTFSLEVGKMWNAAGTTFNWYFTFEGEFNVSRSDFYISTSSLDNTMHFTPHVTFKGANNVEF